MKVDPKGVVMQLRRAVLAGNGGVTEYLTDEIAGWIEAHDQTEAMLERLVDACTPTATASDEKGVPFGVRVPEKDVVEAARSHLRSLRPEPTP